MRGPEINLKRFAREAVLMGSLAMTASGCVSVDKIPSPAHSQSPEPKNTPSPIVSIGPSFLPIESSEPVITCISSPDMDRCGTQIEIGTVYQAKATDFIMGDVIVGPVGTTVEEFIASIKNQNNPNIIPMYDSQGRTDGGKDERKTGLITYMEIDGAVYAPWGAGVAHNVPEDQREGFIDGQSQGMQSSGCLYNETGIGCIDGVYKATYSGSNTKPQGSGNLDGYIQIVAPTPHETTVTSQSPSPSSK